MKFPGKRKSKHYFPVDARDPLLKQIQPESESSVSWIAGIDQTLLDLEAKVDDAFVQRYGLSAGHSLVIEDDVAEALLDNLDLGTVLVGERCKLDVGLDVVELPHLQPVVGRLSVDERHLLVGCLLARVNLDGCDEMVEEELALNVGSVNANLVHANLGSALHVALEANPHTAPTLEVDVDRER